MAIPFKLGLLPGLSTRLVNCKRRTLRLALMRCPQFLPSKFQQRILCDFEFDEILNNIFADMAEPRYVPRDDDHVEDEFRLRPSAKARLRSYHRTLRTLALGGYVSDVLGTFRKLLTYAEDEDLHAALEQIYALRGRVSWYHGQIELMKGSFAPFPLFDTSIMEVADYLDCGLGSCFLEKLDQLSSIELENKINGLNSISDVCSSWIDDNGDRAAQFASYVQRLPIYRMRSSYLPH